MKNLIIAVLAALPLLAFGQNPQAQQTTQTKHFRSSDKLYNDWSAYFFGGTSLIQTGDLASINNGVGDWDFGYDFQIGVNKSINHAFGLIFQVQKGKTKQRYIGTWKGGYELSGHTDYLGYAIIADVNLTTLFRRFDNHSPYTWAFHGYAGMGFLGYTAKSNAFSYDIWRQNQLDTDPDNDNDVTPTSEVTVTDESAGLGSFYSMLGVGLKYRVSKRVDLEMKAMYQFTGDEEFDGSGDPVFDATEGHIYSPADIEEQRHDNFVTIGLGLNVKFGKHPTSLMWEYWPPQKPDQPLPPPAVFCEQGDADQDGVCDDWDKCLETPLGARIDGSGCALDTDLDGIIDLYDDCVTDPGTAALKGCPESPLGSLPEQFQGIEFALDSDKLRPVSFAILDNAANVIIKYGKGRKFLVEGHTDTRGSEDYNLDLSQRRVNNVVNYLVSKGVPRTDLIPKGVGEADLLYPECADASKCKKMGDEWKNEANRRVVFKVLDAAGNVAPPSTPSR